MNSKEKIIEKYQSNIKNLKKHNDLYFNKDNPKISDAEYDKIKKETIELEKKHDFLKKIDSVKDIVGAPPTNKFKKIKHLFPLRFNFF